ncbi:hypothetical protein [Xanthocytophaga agilis]|uniref:Uncharacterized protein n=1 Tax=Xanthocytophaga agilis TaxID=3048010 RepID=A0AAE3UJZ1_9BACT|nr:hypothetical protein [Xanthocytophaga agilis]MDJ1506807.1 hypothetical protein [Xanthocytophaga agilis]
MRTIKNILFLCTLGLLPASCSRFDQNDFISTQKVGQIGEETFLYSAFQTGLDNYRIEFKVSIGTDTTNLFDFFINDALYTKENSFHFQTSHDTLIISTPFQLCKSYRKTHKGTTIEITNNADTTPCQD